MRLPCHSHGTLASQYTVVLLVGMLLMASVRVPAAAGAQTVGDPPASESDSARPNVLFIVVDDLRPELGAYGKDFMHTPHIDQLARQGMLFERAYVQQAVCAPSRNSMLTGLRPDSLGIYDLGTFFRTTVPDVVTLPQHFKRNGYQTEGMGKVFHRGHGNRDDTLSWSRPSWYPSVRNYAPRHPETGKRLPWIVSEKPTEKHYAARLADHAIERMRALRDTSFFLTVGFRKPHLPFKAPKKFWDLYDRDDIKLPYSQPPDDVTEYTLNHFGELKNYHDIPQEGILTREQALKMIHGYRASVSLVDVQVGRILEALEQTGLDENTLVVLWGDHGWKLGEYSDWNKHTNMETDTRVPLIVRAPGYDEARTDALVESIDIYPSLVELAGLPQPDHLQGRSFVPLLNDSGRSWKQAALSQYDRGQVMGYSLHTDRYRFVSWQKRSDPRWTQALELYDHRADPKETNNVAHNPEYAEVVQRMKTLLDEWRAGQGAGQKD